MFPPELEIKDTTESNTSASYLDLLLSIGRDGQLRTSLYDKRDDFNFHITNFPFLSSNIPSSPAYGIFISQLIRYARACSSYECFILRAKRLSNKLLGQGYVKERLKSSLRKFYGRYGDLTKQYEVPLSRMLHDILDDDHIQWHPQLIGHNTNFWPLLIWTLLPNLTVYLIVQGVHRTYATGAACQQRTLTPPDTWSCPTLGLACVLMSRPISPELVLSPDFWISNTPRYFSFAFQWYNMNCNIIFCYVGRNIYYNYFETKLVKIKRKLVKIWTNMWKGWFVNLLKLHPMIKKYLKISLFSVYVICFYMKLFQYSVRVKKKSSKKIASTSDLKWFFETGPKSVVSVTLKFIKCFTLFVGQVGSQYSSCVCKMS